MLITEYAQRFIIIASLLFGAAVLIDIFKSWLDSF
jgi:hypothetical protein